MGDLFPNTGGQRAAGDPWVGLAQDSILGCYSRDGGDVDHESFVDDLVADLQYRRAWLTLLRRAEHHITWHGLAYALGQNAERAGHRVRAGGVCTDLKEHKNSGGV